MESSVDVTEFSPPYISFSTLENMLERMRKDGIPSRVDRSYLASWSGSAQSQFLRAARMLDLLDENGKPTDLLIDLVNEPDNRPGRIGKILQTKYWQPLQLGTTATQAQLEEAFRQYPGISGSTVRKAISFYLGAAQFAGIPLSPHFRVPRQGTTAPRKPRRRAGGTKPAGADPPNPPNPLIGSADDDQRKAYIELLMKKAESEGDADLYARIEWLLGYRQTPPDGQTS